MDNFEKIRNERLQALLAARKKSRAGFGASARPAKGVAPATSGSGKRAASPGRQRAEDVHSAKKIALARSVAEQPDYLAQVADTERAVDVQTATISSVLLVSELAGTEQPAPANLPPVLELSEEGADSSPDDLVVTQRPGKEPTVASSQAGDAVATPPSSREPAEVQTNLDALNSPLPGYLDGEPEAMTARVERLEVQVGRLVGFLMAQHPNLPAVLAGRAWEVVQQTPIAEPASAQPAPSQPAPALPPAPAPAVDDLLGRAMHGLDAALLGAQSAALDGVRSDILGVVARMDQIQAEIIRTRRAGDERDNEAQVGEMVQAGCFVWSGGARQFLQSFVGPIRARHLEAELAPKLPEQ